MVSTKALRQVWWVLAIFTLFLFPLVNQFLLELSISSVPSVVTRLENSSLSVEEPPTQIDNSSSSALALPPVAVAVNKSSLRCLVTVGCSGSGAAGLFLTEIFEAHGYTMYRNSTYLSNPHHNPEWLKHFKNPFFRQARTQTTKRDYESLILIAMDLLQQDAISKDKVVYFKADAKRLFLGNVMQGLIQLGTLFTHVYRWNVLDKCICEVRDCFTPKVGFSVFANNGTRSSVCFKRREHPEIKVQARFHKGAAASCVSESSKQWMSQEAKVHPHIIAPHNNSKSISAEDLFAFQYTSDETAFETSLRGWMSLTTSLMGEEEASESIIRDFLLAQQNTRSPPKPHKDLIYNFEEVLEELRAANLTQFLRET